MPLIRQITTEVLEIPLRHLFATAQDVLARQVSTPVAIHLELDDGRIFTGESVPVPYVTGETTESVVQGVTAASGRLVGQEVARLRPRLDAITNVLESQPSARAGLEVALYRAYAATLGASLWQLHGGATTRVTTDITLPIVPDVLERAHEAAAKGFRIFKMKVGSGNVEQDFDRLVSVHEAIPSASFRLDANQAFEPDSALRFIKRALDRGIVLQLVEQPTEKSDLKALDAVARASPVPVFADEAVRSPQDAIRLIRETDVHGLNVKLMKSGVTGALDIIAIARAAGKQLMIGCMLESRRGIAASLEIACGTGAFNFVDLDSHLLLREDGENPWFTESGPILAVNQPV